MFRHITSKASPVIGATSLFLVCAFLFPASAVAAVPQTGLVAGWAFDEGASTSAYDSSGNTNTGTLTNGPLWVTGKSGMALLFDGANDYVRVPHKTIINPSSSLWSISLWVKTTSANGVLLQKGSGGPDEYKMGVTSGYPYFTINSGGAGLVATSTSNVTINDGAWHNVVGIRTAANSIAIYVDGIARGGASYSGTATTIDATNALYIGSHSGTKNFFAGTLDEVRIYNRALSTSEVQDIFTGTGGSTPSDTTMPSVSITSPISGTTVSSVVTITANASDNIGVAGVQFTLDGINLGAEDTTAPYSISWNTTTASNALHTLTATARDVAGNAKTSSGVSVTVSNTTSTGCTYPAQVLDLTNWKETLPTGPVESPTEIRQPALATYTNDPYFKVNSACTGVQFRAPVNGVTTSHSGYPRSELREMINNGSANASWATNVGVHTMFIDQAITAYPKTKKHVVVGQIHDATDDVIVIRLEYPKLFVDINGATGPILDANYTLGKRFNVKLVASNGQIKVYYNGNTTPSYTLAKSAAEMYFKAGMYTQSNCTTELAGDCVDSNYGEAHIYNVWVTHESSSSDTTAPILSGITASSITTSGATISWTTNESADTQVEYGLTTSYGNTTIQNTSMVTSHSQTLSALSAGTTYHYRVKSRDAAGNLVVSSDKVFTTTSSLAPDTTDPSVPTNLTATALSTNQINLSWNASTDPTVAGQITSGMSGYRIERCTGSGCTTFTQITSITTNDYTDSSLSAGTTYTYRVKAFDAANNFSAPSGTVSATTQTIVPSPDSTAPIISNIVTNGNASSTTVTWTTNELSHSTLKWGTAATSLISTATNSNLVTSHSLSMIDLKRRTTYYYQVFSADAAGNTADSTVGSFKTGNGKTSPITDLQAAYGSVRLSWTKPDDEFASRIEIYRSTVSYPTNADTSSLIATITNLNKPFYRDTTVTLNTTYYYTLYAIDDLGIYSDPAFISFTPEAPGQAHSSIVGRGSGGTLPLLPSSTQSIVASPIASTPTFVFARTLNLGASGADVALLQELLKTKGFFPSAQSVTGYFGNTTQQAVKDFQCRALQICSGTPATTGWGQAGKKTREAIAELH